MGKADRAVSFDAEGIIKSRGKGDWKNGLNHVGTKVRSGGKSRH